LALQERGNWGLIVQRRFDLGKKKFLTVRGEKLFLCQESNRAVGFKKKPLKGGFSQGSTTARGKVGAKIRKGGKNVGLEGLGSKKERKNQGGKKPRVGGK